MPNLTIVVDRQSLDPWSSEIQCKLTIRNEGRANIQLLSIRVSNQVGAEVQQVLDRDLTKNPGQLNDTYRQLERLLGPIVKEEFYRTARRSEPSLLTHLLSFLPGLSAGRRMHLEISHSIDAEEYFARFVEGKPDLGDAEKLVLSFLATAKRLEQILGLGRTKDGSGTDQKINYVADIEPNGDFVRDYIVKCKRKWLSVTSYAVHFDCRYVRKDAENVEMFFLKSHSFTGPVAPSPWATSVFAAVSSPALGVILKACLNLVHDGEPNYAAIREVIGSGSMVVSLVAAALTSVLFYNVFERTNLGKKLESSAGWRTAFIIGGFSGLLNEKVVAALEDLLG